MFFVVLEKGETFACLTHCALLACAMPRPHSYIFVKLF